MGDFSSSITSSLGQSASGEVLTVDFLLQYSREGMLEGKHRVSSLLGARSFGFW